MHAQCRQQLSPGLEKQTGIPVKKKQSDALRWTGSTEECILAMLTIFSSTALPCCQVDFCFGTLCYNANQLKSSHF